jgi:hypothetical protein
MMQRWPKFCYLAGFVSALSQPKIDVTRVTWLHDPDSPIQLVISVLGRQASKVRVNIKERLMGMTVMTFKF